MGKLKKIKSRVARRSSSRREADLFSVVLLWDRPTSLWGESHGLIAAKAIRRSLREECNEYAVVQSNRGVQIEFIKIEQMIVRVNNLDKSYFAAQDLPRFIKQAKEMRTRNSETDRRLDCVRFDAPRRYRWTTDGRFLPGGVSNGG